MKFKYKIIAPCFIDPQSFNRYSYVENQPVDFADNSGLLLSLGEEQGWCDVDGICNFTFGWANGAGNFDMTPGGGCGSVSSLGQGACQLPPGLWPNGQPIMQSGVSIDIGGNLYGNLPGTNISISDAQNINLNQTQEPCDIGNCNSFIPGDYAISGWAHWLLGSCFKGFLNNTIHNMFDIKDLTDAGITTMQIKSYNAALEYALNQGLLYPFQSSVFRELLGCIS